MELNHKYVILGAGPAGLQMAYFLERMNLDYLVLEKKQQPGSFFAHYPIHKKLISINKKYNYFEEESFNLRHDWNSLLSDDPELRFTKYSDDLFPSSNVLVKYLNDYTNKLGLRIQFGKKVEQIQQTEDDKFSLQLADGTIVNSDVLLLGTGAVSQHMPTEIEGIEHTTNYGDLDLNLEKYKNKRVGILGGGNSGFETADYLAGKAAHVHVFVNEEVKMAWESHFVGDLRAVNNNLLDMYQLKSLHAVLNPRIKKIKLLPEGTLQTEHEYDYPEGAVPGTLKLTREYDYIINCTGFKYTFDSLFHKNNEPETIKEGKFYKMDANWESTNIKNLFFIGTNMQAIDRKSSSGFIHGFRYNIRSLSKLLFNRYENQSLPYTQYSTQAIDIFLKRLYERFSLSDGLFQLYGFLGDMLVLNQAESSLDWYEELPLKYIDKIRPKDTAVLTLSLEFGFDKHSKSSLEFLGPSDPHNTKLSAFLHPVIRYYEGEQYDEFHFGDSLLGRWDMPHSSGGAIASYHSEFHSWLCKILKIDSPLSGNLRENPNYDVW